MTDFTYTFDNRDDALTYLREVGALWIGWVVALFGLMLTNAGLLIAWGVASLVVLMMLARPLQRRAEKAVPENVVEGGTINTALRGGTTRDRVLRDLSYGTGPLRAAQGVLGWSPPWVLARPVGVALSLLALGFVIFGPRPG